jgi:hypothetical protein
LCVGVRRVPLNAASSAEFLQRQSLGLQSVDLTVMTVPDLNPEASNPSAEKLLVASTISCCISCTEWNSIVCGETFVP